MLRAAAAGLENGRLPGSELVQQAAVTEAGVLERIVSEARSAASGWAVRGAGGRAEILHAAGQMLASRRAELLEVMVAEAGKTLAEGDPEIAKGLRLDGNRSGREQIAPAQDEEFGKRV